MSETANADYVSSNYSALSTGQGPEILHSSILSGIRVLYKPQSTPTAQHLGCIRVLPHSLCKGKNIPVRSEKHQA